MATNSSSNITTAATGTILQGAGVGTANTFSTATYPATATGTGKILRADGTNWAASTATYPDTAGTSGNVLTSDGTNWNSTAPSTFTAVNFLAYVNTTITNVSGDGTVYTVIFDTEVFDAGNNFNLGTSTFTAPATGKYFLQFACLVVGATAITGGNARIVTTARTYNQTTTENANSLTSTSISMCVLADMSVNDTATFTISTSDSGGKVDDVSGTTSGNLRTYCSGYRVA